MSTSLKQCALCFNSINANDLSDVCDQCAQELEKSLEDSTIEIKEPK